MSGFPGEAEGVRLVSAATAEGPGYLVLDRATGVELGQIVRELNPASSTRPRFRARGPVVVGRRNRVFRRPPPDLGLHRSLRAAVLAIARRST